MLTVSGAFIVIIEQWLRKQGYGRSSLCRRIQDIRPDRIVEIAFAEKLLQEAATISGQPLAALEIGKNVQQANFGSLGHMLSAAATLEQLLRSYVFYEELFYGSNIANVHRDADGMELYWQTDNPPIHYARVALSAFASAIELVGLPRSVISHIEFPFEDEANKQEYLSQLGCQNVSFGHRLAIRFEPSALEREILFAVQDIEKRYVTDSLLPEISDKDFAYRLYKEIVRALPKREARLDVMASQLAMSTRTLQRRLAEFDDGLRGIVQRVRMHLACIYLKDQGMNLLAVSLLLGYAEQSAFQLAFKRYHGVSPGVWRKGYLKNN